MYGIYPPFFYDYTLTIFIPNIRQNREFYNIRTDSFPEFFSAKVIQFHNIYKKSYIKHLKYPIFSCFKSQKNNVLFLLPMKYMN